MPKCSVESCEKQSVAKGLCTNHYYRLRKHGDPTTTKQVQFHGLTLPERFSKYVKKTDTCWLWVGSRNNKGYGQFRMNGKPHIASRVAWEIANGPIPAGKYILHKCDTPLCVNPDHLYVGDQADNMGDMWERGRAKPGHVFGARHGMARLTEEDVAYIRQSPLSAKELCEQFNLSHTTVSDIRLKKTWKHVKGE